MILNTFVSHIGSTSFTLSTQILSDSSSDILAEAKRRIVSVDMATRKSSELPPEFTELYGETAAGYGEEGKFPEQSFPLIADAKNVHTIKNTVRHSDLDFLFHMNQGSFLRYSQDCAAAATDKNHFKQFSKDICFYPVRETDVLHKGEAFPGDELEVHAWEDPKLNMSLNFLIKKKDKEIFYAKFSYYNENLEENVEENVDKAENTDV